MVDSHGGSTTTCHNVKDSVEWVKKDGSRILYLNTLESPYKSKGEITLNNNDGLLFTLPLKGERVYISWGEITEEGPIYSTSPALWVKQQTFYEAQGVKQCKLECIGMMDLLGMDEATEEYVDDGTTVVGTLIIAILNSTLACFDNCKYYNVILDDDLDDLWTGVYLGESFVIKKGETRAHTLARLFDMTHASMRPGNESVDDDNYDTIHVFTPSSTVQSEYALERYSHRFYMESDSSGVVYPNEIIVKTPTGASPAYTATARDADSYAMNPCIRTILVSGLISSNQAQTVANTIMSNIINAQSGSNAMLPMDCGTEIFDRIKITSKRSDGRVLEGCVGQVERTFNPVLKEPRYDMEVSFGKWFDPRRNDDSLGYGYGFIEDGEAESGGGDSGHINVCLAGYASKYGGAAVGVGFGYFYAGLAAAGDYLTYKLYLQAGSYKIESMVYKGGTAGILQILIDDVEVAEFDCRGATEYVLAESSAFTVSSGDSVLKLKGIGDGELSGPCLIVLLSLVKQ
jgi:hypothetical protein